MASSPAPDATANAAESPEPPASPLGPVAALIASIRPKQWVKNLFVAAPVIFSKNLLRPEPLLRSAAALLIFCMLSGAVYLLNDIVDAEKDRLHPRKRFRPIASGRLQVGLAKRAAVLLCVTSLVAGFLLEPRFAAAAATYFVLTTAYSFSLKHVAFLDVLLIAVGFLLRVVAGALAINVEPSYWLLACTGLLACFFGFGKRYHELATSGDDAEARRKVLKRYRLQHLEYVIQMAGLATVCAYVMYTLSEHTVEFFHTKRMVWTTPCIGMGVLRYQWIVVTRPEAESPTEEMLKDPLLIASVVCWVALVTFIIYFAK